MPKENITAYSNNTISFLLPAGAIFEPTMSVGSEDDNITFLNLGVAYNDTYDGPYNVFTGKDDITKVAVIDRWNGERFFFRYNTDASSFPPFLDKKPLYFYSSDICRSVSAEYTGSMILKGIELYRFALNSLTLAAPTVNPDNQCYCTDPVITRNCTSAGVLDISSCRGGLPIYISLPHFLYGSPYLTQEVIGLNPIEEEHFTFLDIEPVRTFSSSCLPQVLRNVKDYTIFPLLWLNETAALDDATADMFKAELTSRVQMLETVQVTLMSLGSVMFVLCSLAAC
ncbi:hypothetical protein JZ751_003511, partial [Albula glossodonta]